MLEVSKQSKTLFSPSTISPFPGAECGCESRCRVRVPRQQSHKLSSPAAALQAGREVALEAEYRYFGAGEQSTAG